jgi:predicted membrane channel-forming protein YqfA (hemolysin III family)
MIGSLLTFFAVGLVTLLVAGVVLGIIGVVFSLTFGLATFLLFKVAPILLVGWIVVKVLEKRQNAGSLSDADRRWLDGG